jgi:hypothetical protein
VSIVFSLNVAEATLEKQGDSYAIQGTQNLEGHLERSRVAQYAFEENH